VLVLDIGLRLRWWAEELEDGDTFTIAVPEVVVFTTAVMADCRKVSDALLVDLLTSVMAAPRLSPLVALLASIRVSSPELDRVFQSHSPFRDASHLALHPAPTPSTAALGSSCSLKRSQLV